MPLRADRAKYQRNMQTLFILILIGLAYIAWLRLHLPLTGAHQWDGIIGVLYGLYACSHPAGNVLDLILYGRYFHLPADARRVYNVWWFVNLLVLLVGYFVIVSGLLRFTDVR